MSEVDADLLSLLRCPQTGQRLEVASELTLGRLRTGEGDGISGGLITADGRWLYPIRNGIPVLLADEAVEIPRE